MLGMLPYCISWQRRPYNADDLCCGRTPLVLAVPAIVDYITVTKLCDGRHLLTVYLMPLVLQDIVGLYILANFHRTYSGNRLCWCIVIMQGAH